MQRPDSTGKASKASARRNNTDISRAPIASSPIRLAPLQKSLGRKATPASQHPSDAWAHATAFESKDSDQGSEDFSEIMQRPDSTGKASKASARRTTLILAVRQVQVLLFGLRLFRNPSAENPPRQARLDTSRPARLDNSSSFQAVQSFPYAIAEFMVFYYLSGEYSIQMMPQLMLQHSSLKTLTKALKISTGPCNDLTRPNDKNSLPDHPEFIDVSKIALKTKADLGNKIGKYATNLKTLSPRKAFNTKPLDEKIRMVVEDSIRRNLVSLQGRAARQEGKLILERANVKFTAHLAF
ncbi:hypothetical protein R1sor_007790 [Riccia sorocarpa]|uniref:Uncharacterized protein n=1 Tax=Riccia sorocarpa TaxID=122646 RepID=A0ABD3HUX6_9MARC